MGTKEILSQAKVFGAPAVDREDFARMAAGYKVVPVWSQVVLDMETPVSAYLKLGARGPSFLLESAEGLPRIARYSFVGSDPFLLVESKDGVTVIREKVTGEEEGGAFQTRVMEGSPFEHLRALLREYSACAADERLFLPFLCGLVGYVGYDAVRFLEKLPQLPPGGDPELADVVLMAPETVVVFDHVSSTATVVVNARPSGDAGVAYESAMSKMEDVLNRLREKTAEVPLPKLGKETPSAVGTFFPYLGHQTPGLKVTAAEDQASFERKVAAAKDYIRSGDIFQVVLSQRFEVNPLACHPFEVYRALRVINPSPYMFYLQWDGSAMAGASPEMLVRLYGNVAVTRPIAGTRGRGSCRAEDKRLAAELLSDHKERAEHVMLVDLARNDLGRVCEFGSVKVRRFMKPESFSHVIHLVSEVTGRLRRGNDAVDLFTSCFPAGTLTGAPKIRAMEIAYQLEGRRRGPYGGAVGYFDFRGNMDTCITIRTAVFPGGKALIQAGAGIVADSIPHREHEECVRKAMAVFRAIQMAGREGDKP